MFLENNKQAVCMQLESQRRSNSERSAEMRARLITTARQLFVAKGYAGTSTPAIVAEAGVTRGALYHHFSDKQAIFQAVIEAVAEAVAKVIEAADAPEMSALDQLLAGAESHLHAMREEGRFRLLLLEGPAVLGRETMAQIEALHGDGSLRKGLEAAISAGALPQLPLDVLTSLLSAIFERAAMDISAGTAIDDVLLVIQTILRGLGNSDLSSIAESNLNLHGSSQR